MKSISCALALVALVLSSVVDAAHQTGPSRSRSHHTQLASSLAKKSTRSIERRATPSGWTSQGCVTEGNNGRVLTGYSQQGIGSLTVESCLATCASMAYAYGGVEFGNECYCSDALANGGGQSAAASNCAKPCSGDSSEICGGSGYMSLYKSADTSCAATTTVTSGSSTWTSRGCVTDGPARALTGYSGSSGSNTPAQCIATCLSKGFAFAGMQAGDQCFCGDALANSLGLAAASTDCSSACTGDSSKSCGGSYRLTLFSNNASPIAGSVALGCYVDGSTSILTSGVRTDTSSNTPASCMTYCANLGYAFAGVEYGSQCFCGKTNTGAKASASDCSSTCTGNSAQKCGGSYRINVYSLPASSSPSPPAATNITSGSTTWSSLGCYTDSGSSRSLTGSQQSTNSNTPASCIATCVSQGYKFAGTQYGSECYCGNSIGGATASASDCSSTCSGDSSTKCGGSYRLSVYQQISASNSAYTSVGCFQDSGSSRALPGASSSSNSMTNDLCAKTCFDQGFPFAGTQYGSQCYCGNNQPSTTATNCNSKCAGDATQLCGGSYALTVVKSTATAAMPLIAGWSYTGCYTDSSSARTLTSFSQADIPNQTLQTCTALCASKGFTIAGTEYANQCYCGNEISNSNTKVDASQCTSKCSGNSAQTCGGGNRITLYTSTSTGPRWNPVGCVTDSGNPRALTGTFMSSNSLTIETCQQFCKDAGYSIAGVEYYTQCYCGNSLSNGIGAAATGCNAPCGGNSAQTCGGNNLLNVYNYGTTPISPNVIATTGPGGCPAAGSFTPTLLAPSSGNKKFIFSHHIVGNTFPFTQDSWLEDITLAYNSGVDAFALNLGTDSWQRTQVASAYAAAKQHGKGFKLFFSFDLSVWGCGTLANSMVDYVAQFAADDSQFLYNGKVFVSSFAGEECGDSAWVNFRSLLKAKNIDIYFVPGFFGGTSTNKWASIDGIFNWNSAWSMDAGMIKTDTDIDYMNAFSGKSYMAAISPLFYAHYGPNSYNKNWLYQSDAWVLSVRWQQLIAMRDKFDLVEEVTWNDFGESHYMGPIKGAQPNSQSWVNGIDHQVLLQVNAYYHVAYKTGNYPAITCDKIYLQARPHTNTGQPSADTAGAPPTLGPNGAQGSYTAETENFFALVFATADGDLTLTSGSSVKTFSAKAGINVFTAPLTPGSGMSAKLVRKGATFIDFTPSYTFAQSFPEWNFNSYYFASA